MERVNFLVILLDSAINTFVIELTTFQISITSDPKLLISLNTYMTSGYLTT